MPKARHSRTARHLLLAGTVLLAGLLIAAHAAHEPQPVLGPDTGELEVSPPAPAPAQQSKGQQEERPPPGALPEEGSEQLDQLQRLKRLQQLLGQQLTQPNASHTPSAPSPSPAPKLATILPLMPMVLPGCPFDDILDSSKAWDFPKNWAGMSVEQQGLHPINLLLMNMVGVPSTDMMSMVNPCLYSWGAVKGSVTKIVKDYRVGNSMTMKTVVLVFRTKKNVWVVFRSTDDDWVADFDCMYTDDLRKKLNVPTPPMGAKKLQLHRGFWAAYKAIDKQVMQEVNKQLRLVKASNPFHKPQVWIAGHSLGGALATILAFRMTYDPWFTGDIAGVVTYGSPRVGNEVWQQLYQDKLMDITLRWNNHRDLFAALPAKGQFCLSSSPLQTVFTFRHVGKAILLCPSKDQPGLQEFKFFPKGTETSCQTGETLIIGTHLLGHYFDGWRRAYAHKKGLAAATVLSGGPHVRSVMCSQCATAVKPYPLPDNKAARNDGVVSCVDNKSCNVKDLFSVVSWAGLFPTAFFRTDAVCDTATALCQVPSAALTQVQNKLLEIAPNITAAVGAFATKALQNSPMAQFLQGITGFNGTNFGLGGDSMHSDIDSDDLEQQPDTSGSNGEDKGNSKPVSIASTPAAVMQPVDDGADLVVEPTADGHMQLAAIQGGNNTNSSSNGGGNGLLRDAADNAADNAGGSAEHHPANGTRSSTRKARRKQQHKAVHANRNTSSLAMPVLDSNGSSNGSMSGASVEQQPAQVATAALRTAAKGSRPRVFDVVGGFMAGFLSQIGAKQ